MSEISSLLKSPAYKTQQLGLSVENLSLCALQSDFPQCVEAPDRAAAPSPRRGLILCVWQRDVDPCGVCTEIVTCSG